MKYTVFPSSKFKKSLKKAKLRGLPIEKLKAVVEKLADDIPLPKNNCDHELKGSLKGVRECHITPDWLLEYKKTETELILTLIDTGTHSDLFKK